MAGEMYWVVDRPAFSCTGSGAREEGINSAFKPLVHAALIACHHNFNGTRGWQRHHWLAHMGSVAVVGVWELCPNVRGSRPDKRQ